MKNILLLLLVFQIYLNAQIQRIILDEKYSDWDNISESYSDLIGDQNSGQIDFGKLWISNDDQYLFIRVEVGGEINLQDGNFITLYIDTDNNISTGLNISGIGAELEYTLGGKSGNVYLNGNTIPVNHAAVGLITSPTFTSTQFEIALSRSSVFLGNVKLFQGENIRVLFKDKGSGGDVLPNEPGGVNYSFQNIQYYPLPDYSIKKQDENFLRVLTYNVELDGFFDPASFDKFDRILKAVEPDIICFEEIYSHTSQEAADLVESILPSGSGESWFNKKSGVDIIVVSRFPVTNSYSIDGNGAFLLDLRPKYNSDFFLVGAHTPCCANNSGRQKEIDAIMASIRDARDSIGVIPLTFGMPVAIMGDMNMVGFAQQLRTFITGDIVNEGIYGQDFSPDWDGTNLEDSQPPTAGVPVTFTWYNENSDFTPGRLDFIFYTGSVMQLKNSYVLFTKGLPADSLSTYNLSAFDALNASDHLPVVSDFQLENLTAVKEQLAKLPVKFILEQNYPNPFNPVTSIKFFIGKPGFVTLKIYDTIGNEIAQLIGGYKKAGEHKVQFDGSALSSGVYYYRLIVGNNIIVRKMLLLK